ncbi:uncharacterized protein LOC108955996 [Eucalyptus grandis]|uniref:uncharacterized protein LOC120288702 n=1 Tax=Eucalyptus grandis TaxID=71139 RepID=UPI00192EB2DE|nr:uncharacterized protein LOC120288702 [Eucalyptus grandis]XP_039160503.1 uncharacterized protein LOC108955996 [Eucalyptus grandis]
MIGSNEACGSKKQDIPNQGGEPDRVYTSLRAIVNEVASQLRKNSDEVLDPDPISYCIPEHYGGINASNIEAQSSPSSAKAKTRAKSTLVGEEIVSFVLPLDCQIGTDSSKNIQHQSSCEERLQEWHIECR